MEVTEILLIIVVIVLVVFLLLSIAFLTYLISVMKKIDRITDKAEDAADILYKFSRGMKESATPKIVSGALIAVVKKFINSRKDK